MTENQLKDRYTYVSSINKPEKVEYPIAGLVFSGVIAGIIVFVINAFIAIVFFPPETPDIIAIMFAFVLPALVAIGIPLWIVLSDDRNMENVNHSFYLCIEHPTTNPQIMDADRHLLKLLHRGVFSKEQQDQIRLLRNQCCNAKGYHPSKISDYREALYNADSDFAEKCKFKILWSDDDISSCKAVSAADSATTSGTSGASTGSAAGTSRSSSNTFYIPPSGSCEDDDSIALDMEEAIDDDIMFHGGNPFDWDTRSDYLDDPFGFGGDDGDGGEDW